MAGYKRNKNVKDLIERIGEGAVKMAKYVVEDEANSEQMAGIIIRDLVSKRNAKYNDYSGNLRRSYFVSVRGSGRDHLYAASNGVAKKPEAGRYGGAQILHNSQGEVTGNVEGTYKLQMRVHKVRGQEDRKYKYEYSPHLDERGRKRFYKRTALSKEDFYRKVSKRRAVEAPWSLTPHQYIEDLTKKRGILNSHGGVDIVVGNYTPYRRFVEAKGYRVIGGGMKTRWTKKAREIYHGAMIIGFKQLAYRFNKGKLITDASHDAPYRQGRYANARQNAGEGGAYGSYKLNKATGQYEWVYNKLY